VIDRFHETLNRHDAEALEALLTDDTVFEDTSSAPNGQRIVGKPAVVEFRRGWFAGNPDAVFQTEDLEAVVCCIYRKLRAEMLRRALPIGLAG